MIPIVRPSTSPCGGPPPNCGLATHDPLRNAVTASNRRWVSTSIVMMTYSAIAGSWPSTLQMVTPFGTASVSRRSSPAATDCSRRRRGAGGKRRPPDMPDHDLGVCQQWGKRRRIALIGEDRGFQRRLDLGENSRRDAGG